jgi:hypothetical protein
VVGCGSGSADTTARTGRKEVMQMELLLNECHARLLTKRVHHNIPDCPVPGPGHSQGLSTCLRELPTARCDMTQRFSKCTWKACFGRQGAGCISTLRNSRTAGVGWLERRCRTKDQDAGCSSLTLRCASRTSGQWFRPACEGLLPGAYVGLHMQLYMRLSLCEAAAGRDSAYQDVSAEAHVSHKVELPMTVCRCAVNCGRRCRTCAAAAARSQSAAWSSQTACASLA